MKDNLIYIGEDFEWFLGNFSNNQTHKHYAIQLSIPLEEQMNLQFDHLEVKTKQAILVKPNVEHQLKSKHKHLLVLLNPASTIGHYWNNLINTPFSEINTDSVKLIREIALDFLLSKYSAQEFRLKIDNIIVSFDCQCDSFVHSSDVRIDKAIAYLKDHHERVIPLEEVASSCNISASRFLHLFKENTGITYRRAQLWSKIIAALPLMSEISLTEVAHHVGFSDSAHFSRTFKENFGFSPKEMLKLSQFIQV